MNSSYTIPLLLLILLLTRIITVFFHEAGHAIPALIFTREKVTIYLGSYGDEKYSIKLLLHKKLSICFKINLLKWNRGMVKHTPIPNYYKELTILLLGPLMSLLIAIPAIWIAFSFGLNDFVKLFSLIFFCSALFDLRNIYPSKNPIILDNGSLTYCDGYKILRLFKFRKENRNLFLAIDRYNEANYAEALVLFENLSPQFITEGIFNSVIFSYQQLKQYKKAKEFYAQFIIRPEFKIDSEGLCNIGHIESQLGENETAMHYYNQSLALNENNIYTLGNRGYTYILFEQYTDAIADFDKAIAVDPSFAYAYSNRAFAKVKLNLMDDALNDINVSLNLDANESYAYKNLGLYYFEQGEYNKAIEQLQKAYELNPDTHMIDHYIKITREKLTETI